MAQKPDTARNASAMERVGKRKLGYNVAQVNAFLERAHTLYESELDLRRKIFKRFLLTWSVMVTLLVKLMLRYRVWNVR